MRGPDHDPGHRARDDPRGVAGFGESLVQIKLRSRGIGQTFYLVIAALVAAIPVGEAGALSDRDGRPRASHDPG